MRTRVIAGLLLVPLLMLIILGGTPLYIGEAPCSYLSVL